MAALGVPFEQAQWRKVSTLSGGEQKRLVLEALLRGPEEVLLLDEPDNYLDVPAKRWLEDQLIESPKTVLFVSHDRELLDRVATRIATLEPGAAGSTLWVHPGRFSTYHAGARRPERAARGAAPALGRGARQAQGARRRCTGKGDVQRRHGARATRPPRPGWRSSSRPGRPRSSRCGRTSRMRLTGGRTAKRAVIASGLELTGLMKPFDLEVWYGERVAVLGQQRLGQVALPAAARLRRHATPSRAPAGRRRAAGAGRAHRARCGSARGCGPAGSPRPTSTRADRAARCSRSCTAATSTGRASPARRRPGRSTATARRAGEQTFESLSGGQQARFQILLLELSGATCCCSTSRPTTSTCTRPRRSRRGSPRSRAPSWR